MVSYLNDVVMINQPTSAYYADSGTVVGGDGNGNIDVDVIYLGNHVKVTLPSTNVVELKNSKGDISDQAKATYIDAIQGGAKEGWTKYGILPSLTIAQSILECYWGTNDLVNQANNIFSIKKGYDWTGETVTVNADEFINGQWVKEMSEFRKYPTLKDSILDHSKFLTSTRYKAVVNESNYKKVTKAIYDAGYATDPLYTQKLMALIEQYDLTRFDPVHVKPPNPPTAFPNDPSPLGNPQSVITPTPTPIKTITPSPASTTPTPKKPMLKGDIVNVDKVKEVVQEAIQSAPARSFTDVSFDNWSSKAVELAAKIGFVSGYQDGSFHADQSVTRAEFVTMLVKALGISSKGSDNFADAQGSWAAAAISTLKSNGIINGYDDGTFKPNNQISRAEIVAILVKVMNLSPATGNSKFNDTKGSWAEEAINQLANAGIIGGKENGKFDPNSNSSRAEAVTMVLRVLNVNLGLDFNV
ncbi:S-layer homology domain-containing protein [Paenibacillus cremeus]|uniref:SLH domain-containing protein n=1 Tax=Paenibacillus cremeus TaxID=2163881 RepID=A0A559JVY6_9BACL|nr:S-layer homology domain-containing protein [Paenibacillus cremeus]TVY03950.1 hypothetical protein FPZ49_30975 [Paenibacillus cremeus]